MILDTNKQKMSYKDLSVFCCDKRLKFATATYGKLMSDLKHCLQQNKM